MQQNRTTKKTNQSTQHGLHYLLGSLCLISGLPPFLTDLEEGFNRPGEDRVLEGGAPDEVLA